MQLNDVTKRYDHDAAPALADVTMTVHPGESLAVMGPSGSGKSTLMAVLSGLLRPDCGKVLALGADLWRLSDRERKRFRLRHCGFIFQGYNLFPALNARQQLEMVYRTELETLSDQRRQTILVILEALMDFECWGRMREHYKLSVDEACAVWDEAIDQLLPVVN